MKVYTDETNDVEATCVFFAKMRKTKIIKNYSKIKLKCDILGSCVKFKKTSK